MIGIQYKCANYIKCYNHITQRKKCYLKLGYTINYLICKICLDTNKNLNSKILLLIDTDGKDF